MKAGLAYFSLVFAAGFVLGGARTLFVMPTVGELIAVLLELPIILIVSWIACGWSVRRFHVPGTLSMRAAMGAVAFLFLMGGETFVSVVFVGRNLAEHVALYRTLPVIAGLLGQIAYAGIPLFRSRRQTEQARNTS